MFCIDNKYGLIKFINQSIICCNKLFFIPRRTIELSDYNELSYYAVVNFRYVLLAVRVIGNQKI